jgi:hypothetical protein
MKSKRKLERMKTLDIKKSGKEEKNKDGKREI